MGEMMSRMVEVLRLALVAQVGLATVLGGAIGLERELGGKPAGLRTNILICIGSVLYTHLSIATSTQSAIGSACTPAEFVSTMPVPTTCGMVDVTPAAAVCAHRRLPCPAFTTPGGTPNPR